MVVRERSEGAWIWGRGDQVDVVEKKVMSNLCLGVLTEYRRL